MARSKGTLQNIDKSDPNYLEGRTKDNTGSGGGTPVNEFVYGDIHQFFAKLMHLYNITYSGLPDNEENGYQLIDALIALASKNDFELNLSSQNGKLQVPVKIAPLKNGEVFLCKASVNKANETLVRGTLDNTEKAASFSGDFKTGDYVLMINTASSVNFVRMVTAGNLGTINDELKYLKKATQTQENEGTSEEVATTPKTNKTVFERRVNGTDSDNHIARATSEQTARNGLMSHEQAEILKNIGQSRVRNVGYFTGLDVAGPSVGSSLPVSGDIQSATKVETIDRGDVIEVVFANAMDSSSYKLHCSVESRGSMRYDNDIYPLVWQTVSNTRARIYIQETGNVAQNLRIHIDAIQL